MPGAYMAPGPMGDEWRIPITSLTSLTPDRQHPRTAATTTAAADQTELAQLRLEIAAAKAEADRSRAEVAFLREALSAALSKLPPALPPAQPKPHRWWRKKQST